MNNNTNQKGFKTFVLTLSISLIVFSIIYYFVSESQLVNDEIVLEDSQSKMQSMNAKEEPKSEFKQLADAKIQVPERAVLAGATTVGGEEIPTATTKTTTTPTTPTTTTSTTSKTTEVSETTQAAVPQTGVTEVTLGLMFSALAFLAGIIVISKNPRHLALESFEKKVTKR